MRQISISKAARISTAEYLMKLQKIILTSSFVILIVFLISVNKIGNVIKIES